MLSLYYPTIPNEILPRLVVAAQKLPHAVHHVAFRIDSRHRAGAGQRVAREEPLVEHLAAAEGVAGDIPGKAEQLYAVARREAVGGEILLDIGLQRAGEILLARLD